MDLSKVVLPTFILEPRSFLDKLSDSFYHADIISEAVLQDDPFNRMKSIVKWYLSGFYKKPKGLKKPFNPILGETFRCYWQHPNASRTYYIAEQVSHHPPISAFFISNRQDGYSLNCSILAKSKFYGNSTSAILEGAAQLTLLPRGENYTLTMPYAHCKIFFAAVTFLLDFLFRYVLNFLRRTFVRLVWFLHRRVSKYVKNKLNVYFQRTFHFDVQNQASRTRLNR